MGTKLTVLGLIVAFTAIMLVVLWHHGTLSTEQIEMYLAVGQLGVLTFTVGSAITWFFTIRIAIGDAKDLFQSSL